MCQAGAAMSRDQPVPQNAVLKTAQASLRSRLRTATRVPSITPGCPSRDDTRSVVAADRTGAGLSLDLAAFGGALLREIAFRKVFDRCRSELLARLFEGACRPLGDEAVIVVPELPGESLIPFACNDAADLAVIEFLDNVLDHALTLRFHTRA